MTNRKYLTARKIAAVSICVAAFAGSAAFKNYKTHSTELAQIAAPADSGEKFATPAPVDSSPAAVAPVDSGTAVVAPADSSVPSAPDVGSDDGKKNVQPAASNDSPAPAQSATPVSTKPKLCEKSPAHTAVINKVAELLGTKIQDYYTAYGSPSKATINVMVKVNYTADGQYSGYSVNSSCKGDGCSKTGFDAKAKLGTVTFTSMAIPAQKNPCYILSGVLAD